MANPAILEAADLDRLLTSLPREFAVGALRDDRLVAGPAGGFVLRAASDDLERDAHELIQLTGLTRVALSDHLPWVPFLDPLLVSPTAGPHHHKDVTIVPVDLLADVLRDGHQRLDATTMDRIFQLLAERRLEPPWTLSGWLNQLIDPCVGPPTEGAWEGVIHPA